MIFNRQLVTQAQFEEVETAAIAWFIHTHTIFNMPLSELTDGILRDDDLTILTNARQLPPGVRENGPHL